jgi:hypothetical protein
LSLRLRCVRATRCDASLWWRIRFAVRAPSDGCGGGLHRLDYLQGWRRRGKSPSATLRKVSVSPSPHHIVRC